jgi:PAS domain-containing protein
VTRLQLIKQRKECGSFEGDPDQYYATLHNDTTMGQTTRRSIETPDGRTIQIVTRPMADGGWVTTHEDTTDKLIEKQALQLDAALENMSQGLCMFDATQHLIVCNKRYADLYGLNKQQTGLVRRCARSCSIGLPWVARRTTMKATSKIGSTKYRSTSPIRS